MTRALAGGDPFLGDRRAPGARPVPRRRRGRARPSLPRRGPRPGPARRAPRRPLRAAPAPREPWGEGIAPGRGRESFS